MERFGRFLALVTSLLLGVSVPAQGLGQSPANAPKQIIAKDRVASLGTPDIAPPQTMRGPEEVLPQPQPLSMSPPAPLPTGAGQTTELQPAPLEPTDLPLPINLAAALRLADARPLIVAAAQTTAWVAEAQLSRAKVIWVPTLSLGAAYLRHDGFGPDFNRGANPPLSGQKIPLNQNLNWLYLGGGFLQSAYGPAALVSDTDSAPVPLRYPPNMTTDMIFEPLAARQILNSRKWDIQTAKNDALLQTADAYFRVHEYRGKYAGVVDAIAKGRLLIDRVNTLSKDLVPRAEVDRALRLQADLEQKAVRARESWRVSSADLTQILRLDPRAVVVPLEHDHLQITLIDPARTVQELTLIAQANRPEIASQKALIEAAEARIRREKWRPLLPTLYLNGWESPGMRMQAGAIGTGRGHDMNLWSLRDDIVPQISWRVDGFGATNYARVKEQRGEQSSALKELFRMQDAVAAEVTRSQAHLQSAAVRVGQAERSLREALITFQKNLEGLGQTNRFENLLYLVYRPQEVVAALENLQKAYDLYFSTVADYNRAQFQTFHALGYPAAEIAFVNAPGNEAPLNTERPGFLPPVGNGPPPATR